MSLNALSPDRSTVTAAVRLASARTGVDFGYLFAQAKVESGLDPAAAASTSSARGLYQFTDATWLDTVRKHGAEHGLGWAAEAVAVRGADPSIRAAILDLRNDPAAAALMAGEFAADNAAKLERDLGRTPSPTDLYMAHFLGPAGAVRFLRARDVAPGAAAATVAPAAAAANRAIFFASDGSPRSLATVYDRFAAKLGTGNTVPDGGTVLPVLPPLAQSPRVMSAPAQAARFAYLLLAELGA